MENPTTEVLVVDDEPEVRIALTRMLRRAGFTVVETESPDDALAVLRDGRTFDAIVTDSLTPAPQAVGFLRGVRQRDANVPIIVLAGDPSVERVMDAIPCGGFRYLKKPSQLDQLVNTVTDACTMHRLASLKRRAFELSVGGDRFREEELELDDRLDRAIDQVWIAFQPIVDLRQRVVFGHEALVRTSEATLSSPSALFAAAEHQGRVQELGRRIRNTVADALPRARADSLVFINLHSLELTDDDLYRPSAALSYHADRVVLEITERHSLQRIPGLRERIRKLRSLGYRIAIDDLGAGYAGLASFAQLEPDIAKLDMSLVRCIERQPRMASILRSMISVCTDELQTAIVCEGVETVAERDTLLKLGASLFQGHLFALPDSRFRGSSVLPDAGADP